MEQEYGILEILPNDIIDVITGFIKQGFLSWTRSCKSLLHYNNELEFLNRANHFLTIVKYINPELDYYRLSKSEKITIDFVLSKFNEKWDWEEIFSNRRFDLQDLEKLPCFTDNIADYLRNDNCTLSQFHQIFDYIKLTWDYKNKKGYPANIEYSYALSDCRFVDWEFAMKNLFVKWDWYPFCSKPNKNLLFIYKNMNFGWEWTTLLASKDSNLGFIEQLLRSDEINEVDFYGLGKNPNLTMEFIKKNNGIDWSEICISCLLPHISVDEIIQNPQYDWNYSELLQRRSDPAFLEIMKNRIRPGILIQSDNIPFEWIQKNIPEWKKYDVEKRKDAFQIIMDNPDYTWNMQWLSRRPDLTKQFFLDNIYLPWDPKEISRQPFVNLIMIIAYPSFPWDFTAISEKCSRI